MAQALKEQWPDYELRKKDQRTPHRASSPSGRGIHFAGDDDEVVSCDGGDETAFTTSTLDPVEAAFAAMASSGDEFSTASPMM